MNIKLNPYVINVTITLRVETCSHCTSNDPIKGHHLEDEYFGIVYSSLDKSRVYSRELRNMNGMVDWFEEQVKAIKRETA